MPSVNDNVSSLLTLAQDELPQIRQLLNNMQNPIKQGTAFPSTPDPYDLFFRTDRGMLFYYETGRWLSVGIQEVTFTEVTANPLPAGYQSNAARLWFPRSDMQIMLRRLVTFTYVGSVNNFTNYRTLQFMRDNTQILQWNTSANPVGSWVRREDTMGAVYPTPTYYQLRVSANTGSPGELYLGGTLSFQYVGT